MFVIANLLRCTTADPITGTDAGNFIKGNILDVSVNSEVVLYKSNGDDTVSLVKQLVSTMYTPVDTTYTAENGYFEFLVNDDGRYIIGVTSLEDSVSFFTDEFDYLAKNGLDIKPIENPENNQIQLDKDETDDQDINGDSGVEPVMEDGTQKISLSVSLELNIATNTTDITLADFVLNETSKDTTVAFGDGIIIIPALDVDSLSFTVSYIHNSNVKEDIQLINSEEYTIVSDTLLALSLDDEILSQLIPELYDEASIQPIE